MEVTLYTTHCPKCNVLQKKLESAGVDFAISQDIQKLLQLGFKSAPVLIVENEEPYLFKEACIWADEMKRKRQQQQQIEHDQ